MTYPAAYLLDSPARLGEQIGNLWHDWSPAGGPKSLWSIRFKAEVSKEVAELALIVPSLIAEMTPLVLYWNSHIPVWQMSLMMFGAWAAAWWATRIIVLSVGTSVPGYARHYRKKTQGRHVHMT